MNEAREKNAFVAVLDRRPRTPPPIWLMRQAGRYLPEYQETRKRAGSFWTMCMTPELAAEVTVQPIRRFDFDAAILFSDILVIPHALGQAVTFEEGVGPRLAPTDLAKLTRDPARWAEKLAPVYDAIAATRALLAPDKALIGFAGAPWTLAAYMIDGRGTQDQRGAKLYAFREPATFAALIALLSEAVAAHLIRQIDAGADAVQIFDSWASGLSYGDFLEWGVAPAKRIVSLVRARHPKARIIGFPRAVSQSGYETYVRETGVTAVSIDTGTPMDWAAKALAPHTAVQGNLDPIALIAGGEALDRAIDRIVEAARGTPFVFNLGHGVLPETPVEHVARLVERVRKAGRAS